MALINALDRTKHFSEFNNPLVTAEGVLTPAQRKVRALANLGITDGALDLNLDDLVVDTLTLTELLDIDGVATAAGLVDMDTTSDSTDGGASIHSLRVSHTATGIGGVGHRALFEMTTNVALGSWSNALKGLVTYGATGRTNGLGSAILAEMVMSAGTTQGTYAPLEIELGMPANAVTGTKTALINASVYGADAGTFDDNGFILDLQGLTANAAHAFVTGLDDEQFTPFMTAALRIKVGDTTYYIPLATATS
jgi:hypothetical protein